MSRKEKNKDPRKSRLTLGILLIALSTAFLLYDMFYQVVNHAILEMVDKSMLNTCAFVFFYIGCGVMLVSYSSITTLCVLLWNACKKHDWHKRKNGAYMMLIATIFFWLGYRVIACFLCIAVGIRLLIREHLDKKKKQLDSNAESPIEQKLPQDIATKPDKKKKHKKNKRRKKNKKGK